MSTEGAGGSDARSATAPLSWMREITFKLAHEQALDKLLLSYLIFVMTHSPLTIRNNWQTALSHLRKLCDLEETAREFKAFIRARGVQTATNLLHVALAYGEGMSLRETSGWAGAGDLACLTDTALLNRLAKAADWLEHLAKQLVEKSQPQPRGPWAGRRLRLVDATTINPRGTKRSQRTKGTRWRLHMDYDLDGRINSFELTSGKGGESLRRFQWGPGDVAVADRGYAKAKDLRAVVDAGGDFVVRVGWNALRLLDAEGAPFDLFAELRKMAEGPIGVSVKVDTREKGKPHLPARLIITRLPEDKVKEARERIIAKAKRQNKTVDPRSLEAAGYIMLLTSLPDACAAKYILDLYSLRWQIELLFKRMKSLLRLGNLPARKEGLARAWIFSKMIIALLAHKMMRRIVKISLQPASAPARSAPRSFLGEPVWNLFSLSLTFLDQAILGMSRIDLWNLLPSLRERPRKRLKQMARPG